MSTTLTRTVCIKLDVSKHDTVLTATQAAFNKAATWMASVCWAEGITNTNSAHRRVYGETRSRFGQGAQLACCARAIAQHACRSGGLPHGPWYLPTNHVGGPGVAYRWGRPRVA